MTNHSSVLHVTSETPSENRNKNRDQGEEEDEHLNSPPFKTLFFFNFIYFYFIYLFLAAMGLRCCAWAFSSRGEQGPLFVAVRRPLIAVASLVAEHRLQARRLQQLWHVGSVVVAHGL